MSGVSVLMTAHNAGRYVAEDIESLIGQEYQKWELILIDNGSTDGSILDDLIMDERIKLTRLAMNIGRTPALELALMQANHPYVAVLDADDIALSGRLSTQVAILEADAQLVLVGSCVELINSESVVFGNLCQTHGRVSHDQLAERNIFVNSSVMFRRSTALAVGGYDDRFEFAQDYHLFIRLAFYGECLILDETLTQLRITENSYTKQKSTGTLRASEEAQLFLLAATTLRLSKWGKRTNRRRRALATMYLGWVQMKNGRADLGAVNIIRGLLTDRMFLWVPYLLMGRKAPNL